MDRPVKADPKTVGWVAEDLNLEIKPGGVETENLPMPTTPTCDKEVNQDGKAGKPFFKTLESRRGQEDSATHDSPGKFGGPNAQ